MNIDVPEIWHAFKDEYNTTVRVYGVTYNDFIASKNIGVQYVGNNFNNLYIVVDEGKWMCARLKYGI